jgi:hypothetical protein
VNHLRQQLCEFICHESTPVDPIFQIHGVEPVVTEIQSILEDSKDDESISHTLGFIRDSGLFDHPFRENFRTQLERSQVWSLFSKMLIAPSFSIRTNTIYTIAKLYFTERASLLSDALPFYIEKDVINLPYLLAERTWLRVRLDWDLIEHLAKEPKFSTRWSLCLFLYHLESNEKLSGHLLKILEKLKSDPHRFVSAEANFRYERIKVKAGPKLAKPEWRKEVKRIAALEPKATFERIAMEFMRGRSDYTVAEFEKYAEGIDSTINVT